MAKGRLQHVVQQYRAYLNAREVKAVRAITGAYQSALQTITPALDRLAKQMDDAKKNGEALSASWLYEAHRLQSLKAVIQAQMSFFGSATQAQVTQAQYFAVQLGEQSALLQMDSLLPEEAHYTFAGASVKAVSNLVGALQEDSPLADLFARFGSEAAEKASDALLTHLIAGDNSRSVAGEVQDALDVSYARALTITRSEMLRAYRDANLATMQANNDVIDKWQWTATPSTRTCAMCLAMDGKIFDLSEPFESHANCRCVPAPYVKSLASTFADLGVSIDNLQEMPERTTASDWFDQQKAKVKRQILGNAKYRAYADGALSLDDLVGKAHSEQWGGSRYEKSLKEAIGAHVAQKYYAK